MSIHYMIHESDTVATMGRVNATMKITQPPRLHVPFASDQFEVHIGQARFSVGCLDCCGVDDGRTR